VGTKADHVFAALTCVNMLASLFRYYVAQRINTACGP
jgi:hypothetical protein